MVASASPNLERGPRELADAFDRLQQAHQERDRDVARILLNARDALRALSSNRYAVRLLRECEHLQLERRHKGHGHVALRRLTRRAVEEALHHA